MELTSFETAIKKYLDDFAKKDKAFAEKYKNPDKSVSECCKYIMKQVEDANKDRSRCVAVTDENVYGLAVHYYDEADLKVEEPKSKIEVSHKPDEPKKTRKPRTKKIEVVEEIEDDMPEPLEIPII